MNWIKDIKRIIQFPFYCPTLWPSYDEVFGTDFSGKELIGSARFSTWTVSPDSIYCRHASESGVWLWAPTSHTSTSTWWQNVLLIRCSLAGNLCFLKQSCDSCLSRYTQGGKNSAAAETGSALSLPSLSFNICQVSELCCILQYPGAAKERNNWKSAQVKEETSTQVL